MLPRISDDKICLEMNMSKGVISIHDENIIQVCKDIAEAQRKADMEYIEGMAGTIKACLKDSIPCVRDLFGLGCNFDGDCGNCPDFELIGIDYIANQICSLFLGENREKGNESSTRHTI